MLSKVTSNRLDRLVDEAFNRSGSGRQYRMLDLPAIHRVGRQAGEQVIAGRPNGPIRWDGVKRAVDQAIDGACTKFEIRS